MSDVQEVVTKLKVKRAIDVHCHLGKGFGWYFGAKTDHYRTSIGLNDPGTFTPEKAIEIQDQLGIKKAICFAPSDPPYYMEEDYIIDLMKDGRYNDRFPVAFARVNQFDPDVSLKIMEKCEGIKGFRGIKLHNAIAPGKMYGPKARPIFEKMVEMGWDLATIHPCVHPATGLDISIVAERYPGIKFIIQHLGQGLYGMPNGSSDYIEVALRHKNVYFDTSEGTPANLPSLLMSGIPADKILFGSDAPYCNYLVSLPIWKYTLDVYGVSELDQDKIFYANSAKILGI